MKQAQNYLLCGDEMGAQEPTEYLYLLSDTGVDLDALAEVLRGGGEYRVLGKKNHPDADVLEIAIVRWPIPVRCWVVPIKNVKEDGTVYWLLRTIGVSFLELFFTRESDKKLRAFRITMRERIERSDLSYRAWRWITNDEWLRIHYE